MISQDRYDRLLQGQTEIAKKIHDMIPTDHTLTLKQIYAEARKSNVGGREVNVIEGCVNTLVQAGLLRENNGRFKRVEPKAIPVKDVPSGRPKLGDLLAEVGITREAAKPDASATVPSNQREGYITANDLALRLRNLAGFCGDDFGLGILEISDCIRRLTINPTVPGPAHLDDLLDRLASNRLAISVTDNTEAWDPRPVVVPTDVKVPLGIRYRTTDKIANCGVDVVGIGQSPEYQRWASITAPSKIKFMEKTGVNIDPRWMENFRDFLNDVGYRPEYGATLQRVDESKGYFGPNMRWRKDGKTLPKCLTAPEGWPFMDYMDALAVVRMNQKI